MNEWNKNKQKQIFTTKINSAKSTIKKILTTSTLNNKITRFASTMTVKSIKKEKPKMRTNYNVQNLRVLNSILQEFNLQIHLRKFFELGYDDENIYRLCCLSNEEEEELMRDLRIIPGNFPKFKKFLDRVKELFLNDKNNNKSNKLNNTNCNNSQTTVKTVMNKTSGTFYSNSGSNNMKKRVNSSNPHRTNLVQKIYKETNTKSSKQKTKSAEPAIRNNNNNIIQTFVNGQGFGFNYFLDDKTPNIHQYKEKDLSKESLKDEDINNEIDKLLNFYMTQLKESIIYNKILEVDRSYSKDSDSETELDVNNIVNEQIFNNNPSSSDRLHANTDIKTTANRNFISPIDMIREKSISGIKVDQNLSEIKNNFNKNSPSNNIDMSTLHHILNDKSHLEKSNTNDSLNSAKKIKESESNNKEVLPKLDKSIKKQDSLTDVNEINDKLSQKTLNRSKNSSKLIIETTTNQRNSSQQSNNNNSNIVNNNSNILNNNSNIVNNKSQISPLKELKHEKSELIKNEEIDDKISFEKEKVLSNSSKQSKSLRSMPDLNQIEFKNNSIKNNKSDVNQKKNDPEDEFSHIRVVRSYEDKDLRQNIDQFDIEYMCRCLGLALMKHVESSKDKNHILELINTKEKFDFFNSIFNMNFDFFNTFFNLENKISNLEKLENYFKLSDSNKLDIKYFQDPKEEKGKLKKVPDHYQISYLSHMKYSNDKVDDVSNNLSEKSKILGDISKLEKIDIPEEIINENIEFDEEMKTINDYFKGQPNKLDLNNNKYKNLCEKTKVILNQELSAIKEVDSVDYINKNLLLTVEKNKSKKPTTEYIDLLQDSATHFFTENDPKKLDELNKIAVSEIDENNLLNEKIIEENEEYADDFEEELKEKIINLDDDDIKIEKEDKDRINKEEPQTFKGYSQCDEKQNDLDNSVNEDIVEVENTVPNKDQIFESGAIESNYIIDIKDAERLTSYLLKTCEIYDDDYVYAQKVIAHKRYIQPPDPNNIYEFCANIMIMTKMEKEVIIICLIYVERFIFNTGVLMNPRNWKRLLFTAMIIASKIWDDDSFENNHFAQVFTHLKIGEINLLERSFLELINYKVYIKCSEYFKYFFIIKSIALKFNYNGFNIVPIPVEKMMKLQEAAYQTQKKLKKHYSHNNSTTF